MQNHAVVTKQPGLKLEELHLQPITIQPNDKIPSAPGSVWMTLPPTIRSVPEGLEYLTELDQIQIYQLRETVMFSLNFHFKRKFVLRNANGEQCYYAFEEMNGCDGMNSTMHVIDNFKREVLTLKRNLGYCWQHEVNFETATTGYLGSIRQTSSCGAFNYVICAPTGCEMLQIQGPACFCDCEDREFTIRDLMSNTEIGRLTKKWGGWAREAFSCADTFVVTFPINLEVKLKACILGATFLIDFVQFENQGGCCWRPRPHLSLFQNMP